MTTASVAPAAKNTLVYRAPRRLKVELADVDAMFEPVASVHGQKQRLQALGHYYEPIDPAKQNTATEAFTRCLAAWQQWREKKLGRKLATPTLLQRELQAAIREFVVDKSRLPLPGGERRVRLPGALTFSGSADLGNGPPPGTADGTALPSVRFSDERALFDQNPALGKIPLLVKVEKYVKGKWIPAPGEQVHFQLVAPFHDALPAAELAEVNAQRATSIRPAGGVAAGPTVAAGPRQSLTSAYATSFDPADPQRYNAHKTFGGKRGDPVLGHVLQDLPAARFPGLKTAAASPAPRTHSVVVPTTAQGKAGILFAPSRMAGDRYRLRIFLDPIAGLASTGAGKGAVAFETGRFVIYRHLLWQDYLTKDAPSLPPLNSVKGVQSRLAVLGYDTGVLDGISGPITQAAITAFQANYGIASHPGHWDDAATQAQLSAAMITYLANFGPVLDSMNWGHAVSQYANMYVELDVPGRLRDASKTRLDLDRWRRARAWALGQVAGKLAGWGLSNTDLPVMFPAEFETPHLFEVAHPAHYARKKGAAFPNFPVANNYQLYWQYAALIIYNDDGLLQLLLRYLTGGASAKKPPGPQLTRLSSPGIQMLAALSASRLFSPPAEAGQVQINIGNFNGCQATGIATKERAASVYGGVGTYASWVYSPDGFTKNTLHEFGHTLYLRHQYTGNQVGGVVNYQHAGASFCEDHASPAAVSPAAAGAVYDRCLMGYLDCEGEYCGKCHLKLRGWDIGRLPV